MRRRDKLDQSQSRKAAGARRINSVHPRRFSGSISSTLSTLSTSSTWVFFICAICAICGSRLGLAAEDHSAEAVLKSFQLADPNLIIEPVATEPNVLSPVDVAWDENLRMYVCEMRDYPSETTGGTIRMLEDTDGDGTYEKATVFAEGLPFPSSCLPWRGGLLVTAAPDILYLKDTNGDGKADERRVILTGFAEGDQQLRVNGLILGLDGWVYAANGRNGGTIRRPSDPVSAAKSIARNDIRFDPDTGEFEPIAGPSQFGMAFDDWGNRFLSWNTNPIRHVVIEDRDLAGCPATAGESGIANIIPPEDTGRIYPIAKLARRHNRESAEFFNATCGTTIYRGDLMPDIRGDVFVCESLASLVHHRKLIRSGSTFTSPRAGEGKEFLASTDPWFRPVNLETGPDGALYVVDMCRAEIEHPDFIPKEFREGMDFRAGADKGRIWRIRPRTGQAGAYNIASVPSRELVKMLSEANGWRCDTARRLLIQRNDSNCSDTIEGEYWSNEIERGRAGALWTAHAMEAVATRSFVREMVARKSAPPKSFNDVVESPRPYVENSSLQALIGVPEPEFQRVAIEVARARMGSMDLPTMPVLPETRLTGLMRAPAAFVRLAVALASRRTSKAVRLGVVTAPQPRAVKADPADRWLRLGLVVAASNDAWEIADQIVRDETQSGNTVPEQRNLLEALARSAGAIHDSKAASAFSAYCACEGVSAETEIALLAGYLAGLELASKSWSDALRNAGVDAAKPEVGEALGRLVAAAREVAEDSKADAADRIRAVRALSIASDSEAAPILMKLVESDSPVEVRVHAAHGLARRATADTLAHLLEGWSGFPAGVRGALLAKLCQRPELVGLVLDAAESGRISKMELRGGAGEVLAKHSDRALRARAIALLAASTARAEIITRYRPAVDQAGNAARGAAQFAKNCIACHRMQGIGQTVAPDLSGVASRVKEQLLSDILNPSAEVAPDFVNFIATTKSGDVNSGLFVRESPAGVTLRQAQGLEVTIPAADLAEFRAGELSLMPEGFEDVFDQQAMADLLEFLHHGDRAMLERATRDEPLR